MRLCNTETYEVCGDYDLDIDVKFVSNAHNSLILQMRCSIHD